MMSDTELVQMAMRLKEDGNAKFRLGELKAAEGHYKDGTSHLDTVKNDNKELRDLRIVLL
jgi:FK506-binding protein 4/5